MGDPQFRASWAKFVLRSAKHVTDANGAPIVDAVPAELRREIREIGHLGWLDARVFMDLLGVIHRVTGDEGNRAFWRATFMDIIAQPLIAPLARGALTLWGNSPGSLMRRNPEAWIIFARNCGTLQAVPTDEKNSMALRVENVPPVCRAEGFVYMVEGGLESEMEYVGTSGTVETRADQFKTHGLVEWVVRWRDP
jgi:hypothetical protein